MLLPGLDILQVQVLISFLLLEYLDNSNSWIRDISVEFQLVEYDISKVYINWNFYCYKNTYNGYFPSKILQKLSNKGEGFSFFSGKKTIAGSFFKFFCDKMLLLILPLGNTWEKPS